MPPRHAGPAPEVADRTLRLDDPDDGAAAATRAWARDWWSAHGVSGSPEDLLLVLSELVENARRHAPGPIRVVLRRSLGCVHAEVSDSSTDPPRVRTLAPDQPGGRGLRIVAALTTTWGTTVDPTGKVVWADVRAE